MSGRASQFRCDAGTTGCMISVSRLNKSYRTAQVIVPALHNVTLHVNKGAVYGIIGASGAGKSTFIRCLNRLEEPDSGTILIGGTNITRLDTAGLRKARKKIGMIFQHFNLLDSRTVQGNVAFPLELSGCSRQDQEVRVAEILALVGLSDKAGAYPAQLSGGQKQRVGIARALANHPEVLLCDEATSALDPHTTHSILKLLEDINRKLGVTIVLITHEINVIRQVCSEVAVMDSGKIVESGPVDQLLSQPSTRTLQLFLAHSSYQQGYGAGI